MTTAWLALLLPLALPEGLFLESLGFRRVDAPGAASEMLCESAEGDVFALPSSRLQVLGRIDGFFARTIVKQTFHNPTSAWLEARYVHPLPETGAVQEFELRIGERTIRGEVQPKAQARRTYDAARAEGRSAALMEQLEKNLFDTRVANIPPGATIQVTFGVREILDHREDGFSYRFPLPVTPRYDPDPEVEAALGSERSDHRTDPVVDVRVCVRPGVQAEIVSEGAMRYEEDAQVCFRTTDSARDFVIRWQPDPEAGARASAFTETFEDEIYAAVFMVPPQPERAVALARELIFILDTSGSMGGVAMEQARSAVAHAIARLDGPDCFDIVEFDDDARALWGDCRTATAASRTEATSFVERLEADGGTNMSPALSLALARPERGLLRQVIFVTDGAVGHEPELLRQIESERGRARLFTVGIGGAPNAAFMRDAARFGGGTFTFIGSPLEVDARMGRLFEELEHPTVRDIEIDWGREADPVRVSSELYAGQPLVALARLPGRAQPTPSVFQIAGRTADSTWSTQVTVSRRATGLHALWAQARVAELEDARNLGGPAALDQAVQALGLKHRISTSFTSFVAVDDGPLRPPEAELASWRVATPAPGDGTLPQGGTPSLLLMVIAAALAGGGIAWRGRRSCS